MASVGEIVRERRERLGLTLAALADRAGMTKSYLSMIENQRISNPPSRGTLEKLEQSLAIADGELLRAAAWQSASPEVKAELERQTVQAQAGQELARWLLESTGRSGSDLGIKAQSGRKKNRQGSPSRHSGTEGKEGVGGGNLDRLFRSGELTRRVKAALSAIDPAGSLAGDSGQAWGKNHRVPGAGGREGGAGSGGEGGPGGVDAMVPLRYRIPLINKVPAGYPVGFTDLDYPASIADEYVSCPDVSDPQAFAARVVGDSMLPDYRQGDVVIFSPAAEITDGSDCFVRLLPNHETTFKRVFFDRDETTGKLRLIRLQPLNGKYPPSVHDRRQVAGLYKAVWRYQRL